MIVERAVPLGGSVTIDGEDVTDELALKSGITAEDIFIDIPKTPVRTGVVYAMGAIYALCYENSTKYFYKYDGESWTLISKNVPCFSSRYDSRSIVYNDEICVVYNNKIYKYDGEAWTSINLPVTTLGQPSMFVYNNELHMVDNDLSGATNSYYKWDGNSFTLICNITKDSDYNYAYSFVYNDEIYCYHWGLGAYKLINGAFARDTSLDGKIINRCSDSNGAFLGHVYYQGRLYYTLNTTNMWPHFISGLGVYDGKDASSVHAAQMTNEQLHMCTSLFNIDDKIYIARDDKKIVLASRKMYYNEKERIL